MKTAENQNVSAKVLVQAIQLQINQNLFQKGIISREVYEMVKEKIISVT